MPAFDDLPSDRCGKAGANEHWLASSQWHPTSSQWHPTSSQWHPPLDVDWHQLRRDDTPAAVVDPRRRMRITVRLFAALSVVVMARVVQLEVTQGAAFREHAARPLVREKTLPGVRGRILAHDGTLLAHDVKTSAVAVPYRMLEQPADPRWLRREARSRLPNAARIDADLLAAEIARLQQQRIEMHQRLAELCGLSTDEWKGRLARIQSRVERTADRVNQRRLHHFRRQQRDADREQAELAERPLPSRLAYIVGDALFSPPAELPPPRITVAEHLDVHVVADDVPVEVVAEIEGHPERYPGVKIVERWRRAYPAGPLAAHLVGHLGVVDQEELDGGMYHPEDWVGRRGIERQYESLLRARRGTIREETDRRGRVLSTRRVTEPGVGRDLVLTLDARLQKSAETLLDAAVLRSRQGGNVDQTAGGAVLVMDVRSGAIRAAATAPRFDPGSLARRRAAEFGRLLDDPAHPLLDRTTQMTIPPGSVFKTVTAAALLATGGVSPEEKFFCRGYLFRPDEWRCLIYGRHGRGHGEVNFLDALAQSCNVYFFHHAGRMGETPLIEWAAKFGFGRTTGVDLPGEARGQLPTPVNIQRLEGHPWRAGDTRALAVGQGSLTVTPVQIVRMMAAVAGGGRLVTPHLADHVGLTETATGSEDDPIARRPPRQIADLDPQVLAAIREGLERVVSDPAGTAHRTVHLPTVAIAGKTGTAETGGGRADHAWFAGYAPADSPKVAFVIVLQHAGGGSAAAGPVARRLVHRMSQLGYFSRPGR